MRLFNVLFLLIWIIFCTSDVALAKAKSKAKSKLQTRSRSRAIVAPSAIYGTAQLANELNYIINSEDANADIGVYVKSMKYGDSLYARNIHQPLTPASTLKILTAEAALLFLGPDYRFSTQLLTDAKTVKNGILQGNLYVVLSGDPTLAYYDLVDLLLTLKSQQIHAIAGNVYIDNTAYDQRFYGPGWDGKDKNSCYGAPIGASIINHNCLSFQVTPSKVSGHPAQVVTSPKYFYPAFRNSVVTKETSKRSCSVRLSRDPGSVITIDGCMPKGRYAWGVSYVVTDIPEYNRALFKNLLSRLSISVFGSVTFGSARENLSLVGTHASKPLRLLINDMLKKSDNIIAGAIFKKLGQLYTRQPGSWENGSLAVSQILSKRAKVNISGVTKDLVELYKARFDPAKQSKQKNEAEVIEQRILKTLESISSLDEDRIIRRMLDLIKGTLRTNYFQTDENGKPKNYLSLKLSSKTIPGRIIDSDDWRKL